MPQNNEGLLRYETLLPLVFHLAYKISSSELLKSRLLNLNYGLHRAMA